MPYVPPLISGPCLRLLDHDSARQEIHLPFIDYRLCSIRDGLLQPAQFEPGSRMVSILRSTSTATMQQPWYSNTHLVMTAMMSTFLLPYNVVQYFSRFTYSGCSGGNHDQKPLRRCRLFSPGRHDFRSDRRVGRRLLAPDDSGATTRP
jgi:hypothetical protein